MPQSPLLLLLPLLLTLCLAQPTASDSCVVYNSNNSVCTECLPGLYLQFFFCVPCAPLCVCSSNKNYCQACLNVTIGVLKHTAYRAGEYCVLCNQTIRDCLECYNGLECRRCYGGRYVTADGFCSNQTCVPYCQICRNLSTCELCKQGHYLSSTGACSQQKCGANCSVCQSATQCKVCLNSYYPQHGICTPCLPSCLACNSSTDCLTCAPGYMFVNQSCQNTQISNCVEYTGGFDSPTCLVCEPGYYNAGGSCSQCSGCVLCTQAFLCQTGCLQGYARFNYACLALWGKWLMGLGVIVGVLIGLGV